jgi:hypothetical protein
MNLKQIAQDNQISYQQLYRRARNGMSIKEAIAECKEMGKRMKEREKEENLNQIALEHGIKYITFYNRVKRLGWSIEEAIAGKKEKKKVERELLPEEKGKVMSFRPLVYQQKAIEEEVEKSGETLQDWILDAVVAKLEGRIIPR